jgi:hypothetical protein
MERLSLLEMEEVNGGCPGIVCSRVQFGLIDLAVCTDACDGELLYIEAW